MEPAPANDWVVSELEDSDDTERLLIEFAEDRGKVVFGIDG